MDKITFFLLDSPTTSTNQDDVNYAKKLEHEPVINYFSALLNLELIRENTADFNKIYWVV